MADQTGIEWADATFSPWVGCTKLGSPHPAGSACDECYAASWAKRTGHPELWDGERRRTTAGYWQKAHKWNREVGAAGIRRRVFPSLCDPFDNQVPSRWRDDFWDLIDQTPNLDWLLLTKRPQNIPAMLPDTRAGLCPWGDGWRNVWLGTTVEHQLAADQRIPALLAVPAALHFLSCEPLLGPVNLERVGSASPWGSVLTPQEVHGGTGQCVSVVPAIGWVICGGESGAKARPSHADWFRDLRDQCWRADVPFFFKQWGEWLPESQLTLTPSPAAVSSYHRWPDGSRSTRVGKRWAGNLLNSVVHQDMPA